MEELSDNQFEKRAKALVKQYAELVKAGLPTEEVSKWMEKLDKLPPVARTTILSLTSMDDMLRDTIMGRDEPGALKWRRSDGEMSRSK